MRAPGCLKGEFRCAQHEGIPVSVTTLYGIPTCDTVRRARAWLTDHAVEHAFHDFKKHGVPPGALDAWIDACGWEPLLNRRGTTWRGLDPAAQRGLKDAATARTLMLAQPSLIKRPVVRWPTGVISVGFDSGDWTLRL